jgi:hypothetical protein
MGRILPNTFYEANNTLKARQSHDKKKKKRGNFISISLMNTDAKVFNKILAN